jgi:hypothetical protein
MSIKEPLVINGEAFVRRSLLEEALDIIAGYSELYDALASAPSELSDKEKRREQKLTERWTRVLASASGH